MVTDIQKEKERLSQTKFLAWIGRELSLTELLTVYWFPHDENGSDIGIYSSLIPNKRVEQILKRADWDLLVGDGLPGAVQRYGSGQRTSTKYVRFGGTDGIEPLVICRQFHGIREDYVEISEEFRLFHRLYHDRKDEKYIKIDDAGNEHLVAVVEPSRVRIRLREIREFLAIKEMHLALLFDCGERSELSLEELGLKEGARATSTASLTYTLGYGNGEQLLMGKVRTFSRLLGKQLVPPLAKTKSGFGGFEAKKPKRYADFMIQLSGDGEQISNTSDPSRLANYFGANQGQPNYLTPIHFGKTVLDKYYQNPAKYSVEDGYLRCGGLWGMTMDNHHDDRVVAWLGDLGRDLPYEEQLHWRSQNILPSGGVSEVFVKRQLLASFADSGLPEHRFKHLYRNLRDAWAKKLGWSLLLTLSDEDAHCFDSLRVPTKEEQKDFDDVVLALTKLLVDSLNEQELKTLIPTTENIVGSISCLEKVLMHNGVEGTKEQINFLRNLQNLRSSGAAHRKGEKYRKIAAKLMIDNRSLASVFEGILE
jgi:hypothetical protein